MKLYELIELMNDSQRVEILDGDGRLAGEYNGKDSIDYELNDCDVYRIIAKDSTIRLMVEVPTKTVSFSARVSYTAEVEVEVPVTATHEEIIEILEDKASDISLNMPCRISPDFEDIDFEFEDGDFDTCYYDEV